MNDKDIETIALFVVRSHTGRTYLVEREIAMTLQGRAGWSIIRADSPRFEHAE